MTLTFVTNLVHHHQLPVADEFYQILGKSYNFVAVQELPEWLIRGGYDPSLDRPYIIRTYRSHEEYDKARKLIDDSDVVISGAAPEDWLLKRKRLDKVTFHYTERWLKKISLHAVSPRALLNIYKHYFVFRKKRTYMLCASAFTAHDVHLYGCFPKRCFKWGYFTAVNDNQSIEKKVFHDDNEVRIMWCSRFIWWKHPEIPVKLAQRLKGKGYKFSLDMYGGGDKLDTIRTMIKELNLNDYVNLLGNMPNSEIRKEMYEHDIFLFTSDRNEGWGAVLNEAMSCGCVPVASDAIGSAPYLVSDHKNVYYFDLVIWIRWRNLYYHY